MAKSTPELTIKLIRALNESLRIIKDLKPMTVTVEESPSVYEYAEANLVSALASVVAPFVANATP